MVAFRHLLLSLIAFINGFTDIKPARSRAGTRMWRVAALQVRKPSKIFSFPSSSSETGIPLVGPSISTCNSLGGDLYRIKMEGEEDGFLAAMDVPTFAVKPSPLSSNSLKSLKEDISQPKRMGLEGIIPGAFLVKNVLSKSDCEGIIDVCENELEFGAYRAGKNNHGAMQIVVTEDVANNLGAVLGRCIDMDSITSTPLEQEKQNDIRYNVAGINKRWRIYRYEPGGDETFAPHIDAGFPPSGLSADGTKLIWDATELDQNIKGQVSRLTVLIYLNEDFVGGHTKFYAPVGNFETSQDVIASIKPETGSVLVFPQAVGDDAVEYARQHWPLHEGSAVTNGPRAKYVIRTDVLFGTEKVGNEEDIQNPMYRFENEIRSTFIPKSPVFDAKFLSHISSLYNPCMGVENAGPLLYSFVRFTKVRRIVEIGAGYTSIWLLQALKDNDAEMKDILSLQREGKCKLSDWPWANPTVVEQYSDNAESSSLLCVDNCLHQRETATGAAAVAKALGLDEYFKFILGDAFALTFEEESIDMLWCDFGVGPRMKEFVSNAWKSVKPGGFLVCHSTLTNRRTREWLEAARAHRGEDATGIPADEYVEISLLEEHKHYQNSVSVLQRRKGRNNGIYEEPLYSEFA